MVEVSESSLNVAAERRWYASEKAGISDGVSPNDEMSTLHTCADAPRALQTVRARGADGTPSEADEIPSEADEIPKS
eukprot:5438159-Pleurochrysis_carterae.AAC.1